MVETEWAAWAAFDDRVGSEAGGLTTARGFTGNDGAVDDVTPGGAAEPDFWLTIS
jgi:hypothetical protein